MAMKEKKQMESRPIVRINKITFENFKDVGFGEIIFDCYKNDVPQGEKSDILGVYGQNGTGKTTFVEVMKIIKTLISGNSLNIMIISDMISINSEYAQVECLFDIQYENGIRRKVNYSFKVKRGTSLIEANFNSFNSAFGQHMQKTVSSLVGVNVYDECISMSGQFNGESIKMQPIIDSSIQEIRVPFGPASKRKMLINETDENLFDLEVNKRFSYNTAQSFIFDSKTIQILNDSEYKDVIKIIVNFGKNCLAVISPDSLAFNNPISGYFGIYNTKDITNNESFMNLLSATSFEIVGTENVHYLDEEYRFDPLDTPVLFPDRYQEAIEVNRYNSLSKQFESMSIVLNQLVPGMEVGLKKGKDTITAEGKPAIFTEVVAYKDGIEMPIRYVSEGVIKIISILSLIILAYNDKSTTIVIDEFDSGIFEYLLGDIIDAFKEGGLGQFVFTSHNLRPLESLGKDNLYFTTSNRDNRYVHLKNLGKNKDLKKAYLRRITGLETQDEELYRSTRCSSIKAALRKAGMNE